MSEIIIAFIQRNENFVPSHVSEIKKGDTFYLVTNGQPSDFFTADDDSFLNEDNQWSIPSTPLEIP